MLERSGYYSDNGGFAEYVRTATDLAWKIPDNTSYEQAATVSVGTYSAVMCLTHPERLNMTEWPGKVPDEQWVSDMHVLHNSADSWQFLLALCEPSDSLVTGGVRLYVSFFAVSGV